MLTPPVFSTEAAAPPAWVFGVNFRLTPGLVVDGPEDVGVHSDALPTLRTNGNGVTCTVGYPAQGESNSWNDSSPLPADLRLAGWTWSLTGGVRFFEFGDGIVAGLYRVRIGAGFSFLGGQNTSTAIQIYDAKYGQGGTLKFNQVNPGYSDNQYLAMAGPSQLVLRTGATEWASNYATDFVDIAIPDRGASTGMIIGYAPGTFPGCLNHVRLERL